MTGSSPACYPSETNEAGLEGRCAGSVILPLAVAAEVSESFLLIVAMNDPNAASDLALSPSRVLASFDWIST